VERPV
jgi:hypothetical protein